VKSLLRAPFSFSGAFRCLEFGRYMSISPDIDPEGCSARALRCSEPPGAVGPDEELRYHCPGAARGFCSRAGALQGSADTSGRSTCAGCTAGATPRTEGRTGEAVLLSCVFQKGTRSHVRRRWDFTSAPLSCCVTGKPRTSSPGNQGLFVRGSLACSGS